MNPINKNQISKFMLMMIFSMLMSMTMSMLVLTIISMTKSMIMMWMVMLLSVLLSLNWQVVILFPRYFSSSLRFFFWFGGTSFLYVLKYQEAVHILQCSRSTRALRSESHGHQICLHGRDIRTDRAAPREYTPQVLTAQEQALDCLKPHRKQ